MADFLFPKCLVFLKYYSIWALHINLSAKMKILIFMLIKYNTIFKMSLEASNAEPLVLSKSWFDINDKKSFLEMSLALDTKNICH